MSAKRKAGHEMDPLKRIATDGRPGEGTLMHILMHILTTKTTLVNISPEPPSAFFSEWRIESSDQFL